MRPPLSPTSDNVKRASEEGASQTSKKQRLGDTPRPSGAANQELQPAGGNNVDTTTRDEAPPMEVEGEETTPVDEEVPEEATEEDEREGWISKKCVVEDAVAAAKAAAAAQSDGILIKLNAALEKCGKKGAPDSLEKKELTTRQIGAIIDIDDVDGASYGSLFGKKEKKSKKKAQERVRPKLKELIEKATKNRGVALEKAEVDARLRLEFAAVEALPDDEPDVTTLRSLLACGSLLAKANPKILTVSRDGQSGNVDELINALRKSGVELVGNIDGDVLENTKENAVLRVLFTLERDIDALPPQEVAEAVLKQIRSVKHAPRVNKAGCATLATTMVDKASSFAAQGTAFEAKVTIKLGDFPIIDEATHALRTAQNGDWTAAPPAAMADVWSGVPRDSYALRTAAPPQKWPKWLGLPTIVSDPAATKTMAALAKKLAHGEKCEKGKKREQEGGDSEEEDSEEEDSEEEESG